MLSCHLKSRKLVRWLLLAAAHSDQPISADREGESERDHPLGAIHCVHEAQRVAGERLEILGDLDHGKSSVAALGALARRPT